MWYTIIKEIYDFFEINFSLDYHLENEMQTHEKALLLLPIILIIIIVITTVIVVVITINKDIT